MTGEEGRRDLQWYFPSTSGGSEHGLNHAGQESFKSKEIWNNIVREIIQNSLDAAATDTKPVHVNIELVTIPSREIGAETLASHIRSMLKDAEQRQHSTDIHLYNNALKTLAKKEIDVLSIVDSYTTGLTPVDLKALVYQEGVSEKSGNSGGSFGIGKHAPFLASAIKTVCYSTLYNNPNKVEQFIGKTVLAAHHDPNNYQEMLQNVGFGTRAVVKKGSQASLTCGNDIYENFRLQHTGTGIFVIGFKPPTAKWISGAIRSIITNFFAAIYNKKLTVNVNGNHLDDNNLEDIMLKNNTDSIQYYDAIKNPEGTKTVKVGNMRFMMNYVTNREELSNRIAYINRRGMIITTSKQSGKNPFAVNLGSHVKYVAVIQAADDNTNETIRKMEPPSHNSIDPGRIMDENVRLGYKKLLTDIRNEVEKILRNVIGDPFEGGIIMADEIIEFFPVKANGGQKSMSDGLSQLKTIIRPPPKEPGMAGNIIRAADTRSRSGVKTPRTGKPQGGKGTPTGSGAGRPHTGSSYLVKRRSAKTKDWLRLSFNNTATESLKLQIRSAGEDRWRQKSLSVSNAHISPTLNGCEVNDKWITVPPCKDRITIDIPIPQESEYSGYEIIEMLAGADNVDSTYNERGQN